MSLLTKALAAADASATPKGWEHLSTAEVLGLKPRTVEVEVSARPPAWMPGAIITDRHFVPEFLRGAQAPWEESPLILWRVAYTFSEKTPADCIHTVTRRRKVLGVDLKGLYEFSNFNWKENLEVLLSTQDGLQSGWHGWERLFSKLPGISGVQLEDLSVEALLRLRFYDPFAELARRLTKGS